MTESDDLSNNERALLGLGVFGLENEFDLRRVVVVVTFRCHRRRIHATNMTF